MIPAGRTFFKMSGSGNDFVFFDTRSEPAGDLETAPVIDRLCARGTGIGADGVVFLGKSARADVGLRYFNRDGTLASLCGNATLCTARLAVELGAVQPETFTIDTDAGVLPARIIDGLPEIDLNPVTEIQTAISNLSRRSNEEFLGSAVAGVPHAVVVVPDCEKSDLDTRGRELRHAKVFRDGANANFVSKDPRSGNWKYRTFERGVEAETLACGTGAVAIAVLLKEWGLSGDETELRTRSGRTLRVRLMADAGGQVRPSLRGEGRIVFSGRLGEVSP